MLIYNTQINYFKFWSKRNTKIISLDLDGVLNCEQSFLDYLYIKKNDLSLNMYYQTYEKDNKGLLLTIDEEKVQILVEITNGTEVVLSSPHKEER